MPYAALADAVLVLHFAVVVFVVGGLPAVPVGNRLGWRWVNGWPFRALHAVAIVVITLQAWWGRHCPLTHAEQWLRLQAGQGQPYTGSFVQHWVERLMYFEAPLGVFAIAYTVFAALVAAAWWRYPPRSARRAVGRTA